MNTVIGIFTILSAIATAVYAFIAFKTLFEIRSQREVTYQPDIIAEEKSFYIYYFKNQGSRFPVEFSYEEKALNYETKRPIVNQFGIHLYNIGLGAAKQITINCFFELNTLKELINNINELNKNLPKDKIFSLTLDNNKLKVSPPEISSRGLAMFKMDNHEKTEINHLLPVNVSLNPYQLFLPIYILDLYSISLYTSWLHGSGGFPSLPQIKISIEYKDIGNKLHKKQYSLSIETYAGSEHHFLGRFDIREEPLKD